MFLSKTSDGIVETSAPPSTVIDNKILDWIEGTLGRKIRNRKDIPASIGPTNNRVYINCSNHDYDSKMENVCKITFATSHGGKYEHTLEFERKVSEADAVREAEKYLNATLTTEYLAKISDDLPRMVVSCASDHAASYNRWWCLSGGLYITDLKMSQKGELRIIATTI